MTNKQIPYYKDGAMIKTAFFIPLLLLSLNGCYSSGEPQTTPNHLSSVDVFNSLVLAKLECDASLPPATQTHLRMAVVPYDEDAIPKHRRPQLQFTFLGHTLTIPQKWGKYGVSGVVWDSGEVIAEYLISHPEIVRGKSVLELGSGTGLLGMVTALIGGEVTFTDRGKPLQHLRTVTSMNLDPAQHHFHLEELDWTHDHSHWTSSFDVILGADIIYIQETFPDLLRTLLHFVGPRTQLFLGVKIRYERDSNFLVLLGEHLHVSEILYDSEKDVHVYQVERVSVHNH